MTMQQAAINHAAIRNLAAKLERWGLSDPHERAEHIAMNLLADGYAPIETPPPPRAAAELGGPGHREYQQARTALANRQKEAH